MATDESNTRIYTWSKYDVNGYYYQTDGLDVSAYGEQRGLIAHPTASYIYVSSARVDCADEGNIETMCAPSTEFSRWR